MKHTIIINSINKIVKLDYYEYARFLIRNLSAELRAVEKEYKNEMSGRD
jgi:hypothetical protein